VLGSEDFVAQQRQTVLQHDSGGAGALPGFAGDATPPIIRMQKRMLVARPSRIVIAIAPCGAHGRPAGVRLPESYRQTLAGVAFT
jgi:hypothetical protein